MTWKIPLFDLDLGQEELEKAASVIGSKWLTMGALVQEFENKFAAYLGVKHAIAVSSGTAALHLAHQALGLKDGDEVICPSLTFVATANAILYTGARPVFADIDSLDDLTISPMDIERKITRNTRGITVVHYAGFPCKMDEIGELARRYGLYVVEDAAHAIGTEYTRDEGSGIGAQRGGNYSLSLPGTKVGTIGDIGCFSFFSNKNMTTGEGGMVVTNNDKLAERIRLSRSHGMTSLTWDRHRGHAYSYDVVDLGYNYRLDELRAALGLAQLGKLQANNRRRRELAELYAEKLRSVGEVDVPFSPFKGTSAFYIFPIILYQNVDRLEVMNRLRDQGIQTSIHYPPVHLFKYYQEKGISGKHDLPRTELAGNRELTLPFYPGMGENDVHYVVEGIKCALIN